MSGYTVTVHGAVTSESGVVYAAVAYYDGESFSSSVALEPNVASEDNVCSTLLQKPVAFYDLWRSQKGRLYVGDDTGHVHVSEDAKAKKWKKQKVAKTPLTVVWGIDDSNIYAAGTEGVVYRSNGKAWSKLGGPLGQPITNVGGAAPDDLYACGDNGLFAHFDGKAWKTIDLGTKENLMALLVRTPKDVLVGGRGGVIFEGAGAKWKPQPKRKVDVFDLAVFDGEIYVAAGDKGVFTLGAKTLKKVKDTFAVYRLSSSSKYLMLAGGPDAVRFDGTEWVGPTYS